MYVCNDGCMYDCVYECMYKNTMHVMYALHAFFMHVCMCVGKYLCALVLVRMNAYVGVRVCL